jgi:multiple sugar transport system substrate-binding protein
MSTRISRRDFLKGAALAAGAMGAGALSACAPQAPEEEEVEQAPADVPAPAEPVQLSLWRGSNGIWDDHFEKIAEYMADAGITPLVEIAQPHVPWSEWQDKVRISGEAGVGPDLIFTMNPLLTEQVANKMVLPIPEDVYSVADIENDFEMAWLGGLKFDGRYYNTPWDGGGFGLVCDVTNLKDAGVTDLPTNFDEFVEAAQKVVQYDESGNLVRDGFGFFHTSYLYGMVYSSIGGQRPGPEDTEITFDNELGWHAWDLVLAYEKEHEIHHWDFTKGMSPDLNQFQFTEGRGAFAVTNSAFSTGVEEQFGHECKTISLKACIPEGELRHPMSPGWGLAVTSACPEEKLDAAWAVFRFVATPEMCGAYQLATGFASGNKEVQAKGAAGFTGPRAEDMAVEVQDVACCGYLRWDGLDQPTYMHEHENVYTDMLHEGMTAQEAMANRVDAMLKGLLGT